eukprot:COSAG04_NODE_1547_length_6397_cov_31.714513_9_plen_64_part_00
MPLSSPLIARGGGFRREGGAERLTIDHKPGEEGEKARIEALGGTVVYLRGIARLDGNLAVARS